jgi:hypothetical protein
MQQQSITDRPPKPICLPPRKTLRELREDALRVSGNVQSVIFSAAIGAVLAAIIFRVNALGMTIGMALMGIGMANAVFVQSALYSGASAALFRLGRAMVRSSSRVFRLLGKMVQKACAALPLWAGGTDTVRRLQLAKPYRKEARLANDSAWNDTTIEVVHAPVESKRGENLSPIAAMHVALGTSAHAVAARRRIELESARAEASAAPTEDDELWIAAGAMLRMVATLGMTNEGLAYLQASIARWMGGLISSNWTLDAPNRPVAISPDDAWRLERFSSTSLAFIAVAGNHGANAGKADAAIHILYHRAMGYTGAPIIEFITAPDTQPPNAIALGCDEGEKTPTSPPPSRLAVMQPQAEPLQ